MCFTRCTARYRLLLGILAAGFAWLGAAAPLATQTAKAGTLVRVTAPEHMAQPCIGRVVSTADPLVVRERDGTLHSIPAHEVELLEIARRRDFSPEAILGTFAGMAAGGAIGWAIYTDAECREDAFPVGCVDNLFGRMIYAFGGGVIGGLTGGYVGYRLGPERWRIAWQRPIGLDAGLTPRGAMLRVALPTR
jgi:hypothetical protein